MAVFVVRTDATAFTGALFGRHHTTQRKKRMDRLTTETDPEMIPMRCVVHHSS